MRWTALRPRPAWLLSLTLLPGAVLVGCSSAPPRPTLPSTAPASSVTGATTPAGTPPAEMTVQSTSCTDPAGDGGAADLTAVTINADSTGVRVTWATTQSAASIIAVAESGLFNVTVIRADGNQVTDLGVNIHRGQLGMPFVFDFSAGRQTATTTPAVVDGTTITAVYPAETIAALGGDWTWSATTTYDLADVDRCPDGLTEGTGADPEITTSP